MNTQIRPSFALHLASLAALHILDLDGPPLTYFNPDEVNAAEKLLFAWYRKTKRIRKTELAHDAHIAIGDGHLALLQIRWRLAGWQAKQLKPRHETALKNAIKVLPNMAAWCAQEYER